MGQTKYLERVVPTISLANFDSRIDEITRELVEAAEHVGFFCIVDHGISEAEVNTMFENAARFFGLDDSIKAKVCAVQPATIFPLATV
jgi:isopenicillin N synthase-like dioxygenase